MSFIQPRPQLHSHWKKLTQLVLPSFLHAISGTKSLTVSTT